MLFRSPVELPLGTEPPTGQVPQILSDAADPDADADDWAGFATSAPRWRDETSTYDESEGFSDMATWADEDDDQRLGALDDRERPTHDDFFTFADLDEPVAKGRSVFAAGDDEGFGDDWAPEPDDEHDVLGEYEEPAEIGRAHG